MISDSGYYIISDSTNLLFKNNTYFSSTSTTTFTPTHPSIHPETLTKIKPSEAIRLGRLYRPRVLAGVYDNGSDAACTMGAMALGFGITPTSRLSSGTKHNVMAYLAHHFPEMPQYVRDKISGIPMEMDRQAFNYLGVDDNGKIYYRDAMTPKAIEDSFITALEALGY